MPTVPVRIVNHRDEVLAEVNARSVLIRGETFGVHRTPDPRTGSVEHRRQKWSVSDPVTGARVVENCPTQAAAIASATDRISRLGADSLARARAAILALRSND